MKKQAYFVVFNFKIRSMIFLTKLIRYQIKVLSNRFTTGLQQNLEAWKNFEFENLGEKSWKKPGNLNKNN